MRETRPHMLRLLAMLCLGAGLAVLLAAPASAHRDDESYFYLDVTDDSLSGTAHLPYPDLEEVFGLDLGGTDEEILAELESVLTELQEYTLSETSVGTNGETWDVTFEGYYVLDESRYIVLPFTIDLPDNEVPQRIEVTFTPFLDEIPDRNNIALISNDWKRGVINSERNELVFFTLEDPSGVINLDDPSQWRNFRASIEIGLDHIKTGPDHIFFIMVLLLPSVLILAGLTWRPAPSFGGSLWRVLKVATMFTLAHSITFTLAGLDILPLPPSKLVETLIAASIAAAALHNLRPIFGHREWAIAFVFGLFHGMGFAGLVEDLDIGRSTQLVSLLGRNVGIEIGQAIIILIVFPALFILSRTRYYKPVFTFGSLALAFISAIWVVERTLEEDYSFVNDLVDRVVYWPRSFWVCVALTVGAAGLWWNERNKGRLEDSDEPPAPEEPEAARVPVGSGV